MIYLHNATIFSPHGPIEHGALTLSDDKITAVGDSDQLICLPGWESVDAMGLMIVPGFVDLQINGGFGKDFTSDPGSIWQVGEQLPRYGVTSFLPTIISAPFETYLQAQKVVKNGPPEGYHGARVLGLHFEGPFINPEKRGAHDPEKICPPDPELYNSWSLASFVRLVTLAPELPGAITAIENLVRNGVVVSAGHSNASLSQAQAGFDAGISYGTHLFNAMPPLDHRQPGLAGALLSDSRLIAGMIVDGIHIHPRMVDLAWRMLGENRTSLVTDAMAALGMPAGQYQLGEHTVHVDSSSARLKDGKLAGSLLSLDQALQNLIAFTGCSLKEALLTVTEVPAHLLKMDHSLGSLASGAKADFVLLSAELHVAQVWIGGRKVLPAPG